MVQSFHFELGAGAIQVPQMKFTVKLVFANGEQSVTSIETAAVLTGQQQNGAAPYWFSEATAPDVPTLISSSNFVGID
jgi:hypothetical protein